TRLKRTFLKGFVDRQMAGCRLKEVRIRSQEEQKSGVEGFFFSFSDLPSIRSSELRVRIAQNSGSGAQQTSREQRWKQRKQSPSSS
ncbi:MAG TPA: hypothetical protein VLA94_07800, partial [Syntrophales bacterium]|nr:hypothetical protein [Syntrophales bacterium]